MLFICVDVEADGPCPGLFSMIELGAVVCEWPQPSTFYTTLRPISQKFDPAALHVTHYTREQTLEFTDPAIAISYFYDWLRIVTNNFSLKPAFIADNLAFDWQFVNYYFHCYLGFNPFGFSGTNLGSLYKGLVRSLKKNFKHLRRTQHTHDPVDDARGNMEACLEISARYGLELVRQKELACYKCGSFIHKSTHLIEESSQLPIAKKQKGSIWELCPDCTTAIIN